MQKTFYIIDDHEMIRSGTTAFLESNSDWKGCGNTGSGEEALADLDRLSQEGALPSVIICDLNFCGEDTGFVLIKRINDRYPSQKVVVYSMFFSPGDVQKAIECGAAGYVSKIASCSELLLCLEQVAGGGTFIQGALQEKLEQFTSFTAALTRREKEVMDLLLRKKNNDEIAGLLNMKKRVVDNYISSIYDKTGLNDRNELIRRFG